jgi:hypothetical protein
MRMVRQVPKMRRWLGSEKCRSRGERAGAEDGDVSQGRVSVHAEDGDVVARVGAVSMAGMEKTKAAHGDARPGMLYEAHGTSHVTLTSVTVYSLRP